MKCFSIQSKFYKFIYLYIYISSYTRYQYLYIFILLQFLLNICRLDTNVISFFTHTLRIIDIDIGKNVIMLHSFWIPEFSKNIYKWFRTNAPMTNDGQKVVVNNRAALTAMAHSLRLPSKCFVVFSPKEFRIQEISFRNIFLIYTSS